MSDAHLQEAHVIQGKIQGNDTPINSNDGDYDLEGVAVTLYTYIGDMNSKQVQSTFTTKTNEQGIYNMLFVKNDATHPTAVLEFYSEKFNSEYVQEIALNESTGVDFKFTKDTKLVTFDFNGGQLPPEKLP